MIAIVVAAFLFQPFREGIQARLDRFFYRDRLDYRRTLIEFGRTLTNEVRLEPMLGSVMDRVSPNAARRSPGHLCGRPAESRRLAAGAFHGSASERAPRPELFEIRNTRTGEQHDFL